MCDLFTRFTKEAIQFVQDYEEYKKECSAKGSKEESCDHDKWLRWDCCLMHRQLNGRSMRITERATVLDAVFEVGGYTHGHSLSSIWKVPHDSPPAEYQVGSYSWFLALARASGLDPQTVEFAKPPGV